MVHIIDLYSRWSECYCIPRKTSDEVIVAIKTWTNRFGVMHIFLTDNGGKFAAQDFIKLMDQCKLEHISGGSEAAWKNGICERNNGIVVEVIRNEKTCGWGG